ncbi:hypothetical protein LZK98_12965 [Sphingomonas cannabina]|uniref:hypothetical protein n=1 Tax=Sphingomonas cannabina TaxID=2899123 RepID=UPI001F24DD42|nr:hypothetical protein [Sphingomonas cannabina]UIJ47508.1 hypothetical protein LZK98_12965 [Sphingomonas cannabina]
MAQDVAAGVAKACIVSVGSEMTMVETEGAEAAGRTGTGLFVGTGTGAASEKFAGALSTAVPYPLMTRPSLDLFEN